MNTKHSVRAVLFDLDGTLRHNRPASPQMMLNYAVQLGALDSPARRMKNLRWVHYYWAQSPELLGDLEIFKTLSSEFWTFYTRRSLEEFGCTADQAEAIAPEIHRFMSEDYKPEQWIPEDIPATLRQLQDSGFALAVVSNRTNSYAEELASLGLDQYFSFALAAGEINAWKPEPEIFWYALDRLGVQPGEAMYVGDNFYADVVGAQNAGLQPVLVDPDGLFPDANCSVIRQISELPALLS